jgi:hypothetical protein
VYTPHIIHETSKNSNFLSPDAYFPPTHISQLFVIKVTYLPAGHAVVHVVDPVVNFEYSPVLQDVHSEFPVPEENCPVPHS